MRAWKPQRLHAEIADAVAGLDEWPAFGHFDAIGRSDLRTQLISQGGPLYWAHRLEIPYRRVWPTTQRWTEERIRATLGLVVRRGDRFPAEAEFAEMGLDTLTTHMRVHGGMSRWANEVGAHIRRQASHWRWTDETISQAIAELTSGRDTYPSRIEFCAAGLGGLHHTIQQREGHPWWAERLRLPRQRPRG